MRVAAIDIGTNSVHLLVAEVQVDGSFRVLDSQKEMVQLGRGEFRDRRLAPEPMERALSALASFARLAAGHEARPVLAVATSAVREASNGGDFLNEVAGRTGFRVRVITGEEEGRLIYRAVRHYVDLGDRRVVVVDIGGGSVELVLGVGPRALAVDSLKLGHIRLAERLEGDPPDPESVGALRESCREALAGVLETYTRIPADLVVGTSGTIEAFARLDLADGKDGGEAHLHSLESETVSRLARRLLKSAAADRRKLPGLDGPRADTIAAGGLALEEILNGLGTERVTVCTAALREGLILDFLDRAGERIRREDSMPDVRMRSAHELLGRARADVAHAAHVERLAGQLFDDLASVHGFGPDAREVLRYAALLHDVGLQVAHRRHHRHSQYLILHGGLRGFTARETALVAAVARYHRKAPPRPRHPEFRTLRKADRRVVRVLAAILRIADGLDRSHNQVVESVKVRIRDGRASFWVLTWHEAELELWGARRKADLFRDVFDAEPEFRLERPDEPAGEAPAPVLDAEPSLQTG
jgi:exopolyphosphatase/guanosine-5'-triphosphate,3'-diphosphate pyrophosphatase